MLIAYKNEIDFQCKCLNIITTIYDKTYTYKYIYV